ncbi:MAG: hypothetical protein V3T78_05480 [Dehalococcoidia bacterium]
MPRGVAIFNKYFGRELIDEKSRMDFPDTGPGFGSGGLRFRSHLNTNGHISAVSHGHSHSTSFSNAHVYSSTWGNPQTNANSYTYA